MNEFKDRFNEILDEEIGLDPADISPEGDSEAFDNSFENPDDINNFNTLAPEGYAERYNEQIKGWQSKITEFLTWLNGTDSSLRTELTDLDNKYEGITKDSEKKIADIAKELAALNQIVVEIPREITKKDREAGVDMDFGGEGGGQPQDIEF